MIRENDMVYICSPLSAPTANEIRANMELARSYMQLVSKVLRWLLMRIFRSFWMTEFYGCVNWESALA